MPLRVRICLIFIVDPLQWSNATMDGYTGKVKGGYINSIWLPI